jgi:hypothetical protein
MSENGSKSVLWERLVYAVVMALLATFAGTQTAQKETVKEQRFAELENYRQFIIETMENCTCTEE